MKEFSVFDILGPVMIGPSSSHTAGAVRLGKIAGIIAEDNKPRKVVFLLHGSFSETYRGHGTDKALVAGILGMEPWDVRIKTSFEIAENMGIEFEFKKADLGDVHPNTVKFLITKSNGEMVKIMGSSTGGGNIKIIEINDNAVEFTGNYPTLIVSHKDVPGMISKITTMIYENNINIAFLKVYRNSRGLSAKMIIETDSIIDKKIIDKMQKIKNIDSVVVINPSVEGE
ncbi:L-serine ammonia-lyase, iron-sulfur-dependent subunit beta [Clostridium felsineum]|uniref:L-serine deaminase n=1 Tax=Clostridium felsineum TaxID=36839 RepID=A0A1S8LJP6_9CLOT|nr:L-serine ammonia-lyase, iron-sulfur-dependent subunit beta [Clostridium felsineum]URZ01756.1 L-serine dehydratase, beta chain [Clostridium felsineum]URZ05386.1 L-serine dehydratase, beta chain [Clostridium felsineum]URZ10427.1 L-serine dehydratase, beta chain [Clostridium felsineum]URZ17644.1 L-serine dehydratase, beta chain [Clostridium felsineum DSM 794]